MRRNLRSRHLAVVVLAVLVPVLFAACSGSYPNSTFTNHTEFNRDLRSIWDRMMVLGTGVFILVEGILVWTMVRYRRRPGGPEPKPIHGNAALEITWTLAPALILFFIAVPTVRAIWKYEAPAPADALQVEVTGHQWWWEFRYPQYNVVTANELYLVAGRPVAFTLRSADVIHSFWIPQLGGKRDAVSNRVNHLWFTPDSTGEAAFNGSCNEYCGTSHANMRFRAFTVSPEDFDRWIANEQAPARFGVASVQQAAQTTPAGAAAPPAAAQPPVDAFSFPRDRVPPNVIPQTPVPPGMTFDDNLLAAGDPQRGLETFSRSVCIGCHKIRGNPMAVGVIGPDLTHVASRLTIAGGIYPNDAHHLALWIKNARVMKPGVLMNTLGMNQFDPILKMRVTAGGLTDQQIADVVAYLRSLK